MSCTMQTKTDINLVLIIGKFSSTYCHHDENLNLYKRIKVTIKTFYEYQAISRNNIKKETTKNVLLTVSSLVKTYHTPSNI